jgi:rare lipoprotein A
MRGAYNTYRATGPRRATHRTVRGRLKSVRGSLAGGLIFGCVTFACARETPTAAVPGSAPKVSAVTQAPSVGSATAPKPALEGTSGEGQALAGRYATTPAVTRFSGEASYYSDKLAGRSTASGEPYDPRAFTAAHRSLPFGTVVRVVRSEPPGVVYVRINDRGPFRRGRVLDLSRAAAESLEMMRAGVIPVSAEVVEYGPQPARKRPRKRRRH